MDETRTKRPIGLTADEVSRSRAEHGVNVLTPPKRESLLSLFLAKFRDPLIIILMIAGCLSIGISCYEHFGLEKGMDVFIEPVGIFAAIFLATGLGFYFEYRAEKEFAVLNQMSDEEQVQVIRDGNVTTIPRKDVVVGDIVMLHTGEEIPADGRLLESTRLSVDESTLTGEPMCHKDADPDQSDKEATYDSWMVMRGTKVIEGHGIAEVTAVGDHTECGKVFEASRIDNSVKTPLNEQLDRLGNFISVASYIIGGLVIVGRITMYLASHGAVGDWMDFTAYLLQSVMLAVTLVVCSVPEGLPMAVTLALAYSMRRMIRTDNLVRKLHACETMGAVTVICTDKTGTLTANRMQVGQTEFLSDISRDQAMIDMALNSTAELDMTDPDHPTALGNPTEGALLLWIRSNGGDYKRLRDEWKIEAELPFTTERKYMATVISRGDRRRLLVKGAPEIVYSMTDHANDRFSAEQLQELLKGYQRKAMRTLGFASCDLKADQQPIGENGVDCPDLHFDMVTAISDPVREDVPEAVEECLKAGIKIKIVTGDTPATATEIARRIGLWDDTTDTEANITTGEAIAAMTDDDLRRVAPDLKIIARARPMDKRRLVEALQSCDEVVAVTGDGTNDAPALKAAHVGLSMGDGTAVAKEASDITILNNSFSGITNAVVWGRSLYLNIQRFILFQLTVNLAACLTVLIGSFMGTDSPLTVTQMLWINLIMDTFAAMALASLPPSRNVLRKPPRNRRDFIITPAMTKFVGSVGLIFGLIMIAMLYIMEHTSLQHPLDIFSPALTGNSGDLSTYELSVFFTIFIMLQMWNLFNARAFASRQSAFMLSHCSEFLLIVGLIFIGQVLIVTFGGEFFNVTRISLRDWLVIIALTSPVVLIGELIRTLSRKER